MENNLFEELQAKKRKLTSLARKAQEYGWIDAARAAEITSKLESDTLTIGVIGQMKCGKSTFLNSFVFEDDVLPSATTPMTAALSVITYGEEKKIVAEFYTRDEWEEQKRQAARNLEDVRGNLQEELKVKAAKELMKKSDNLKTPIDSLLGKTKEDTFDNLIEYVGADGEYISITKSVTIYYPKEYLKGVEIVDTPGFNDPIVSREERTKAFLAKADVVLLMLYAGRPFDDTDRNILFKNVRPCGTGRVLIGINKYDIPYGNGETENEIKEYVADELKKACRAYEDDTLVEILKETTPIPLSAEMALLSELPMNRIEANNAYHEAWKRYCDDFEISTQRELAEKSHLADLVGAIRKVIETEKEQILFAKPLNAIKAAADTKRESIAKELRECEMRLNNLSQPDTELEERKENLMKAKRRLDKKINGLGEDLEEQFKAIIRRGKNELEDCVDDACKKMHHIVDGKSRMKGIESITPQLDTALQNLATRTLKRTVTELGDKAKNDIRSCVKDFFNETEDFLLDKLPDFDVREEIKGIERRIDISITDEDIFHLSKEESQEESSWGDVLFELGLELLKGGTFGVSGILINAFSHNELVAKAHDFINQISADFDPKPYLDSIFSTKEEVIGKVRESIVEDLLNPLVEQIDEIRSKTSAKEQQKEEAEKKREELKASLAAITAQISETW